MRRGLLLILGLYLVFIISQGRAEVTRYQRTGPTVMVGMAGIYADSEIGRYRRHIYDLVCSTWIPEIKAHMDTLALGVVQISFVVHADGTVTDMDVLLGDDLNPLTAVCQQAITGHAPFNRFNDELLRHSISMETEHVTFTAENDPAHSQKRIEQLKAAIPILSGKLDSLSQYDLEMKRRLSEAQTAQAQEAIMTSSHYDENETRKALLKLQNQLSNDKWELEFIKPSSNHNAVVPGIED